MNARPDPRRLTIPEGTSAGDPLPPLHLARDLTAGGAQARIDLDGQVYSLRITRQGKLILTK
jgi:hemin uptake protein HemP